MLPVTSAERYPSLPIEIVRPRPAGKRLRAAIFDFDGTLSLLRRNWQDVMIPMMVEILVATGTDESPSDLYEHVEQFVMRLNGRQTIYQMIQLAEEVEKRGSVPLDPLQYKHQYHQRLWVEVGQRVDAVRRGQIPADEMTVPGARELLDHMSRLGVPLYLASGTDLAYVRDELRVLSLDPFFGQHVYGALDDYRKFSKAMIIEQIIRDIGIAGEQIVAFGDGFVEIEEVKRVGGTAVGVASNEVTRHGINQWKRTRLIQAGADVIIGDYRHCEKLLEILGLDGPVAGC